MYVWRMKSGSTADDVSIEQLPPRHPPAADAEGRRQVEFHMKISIPRMVQWVAGAKFCELSEKVSYNPGRPDGTSARQLCVVVQNLNWTDSFRLVETSTFTERVDGTTDYHKVLFVQQYQALPSSVHSV